MNEDELRDRLEGAVRDIAPAPRLDAVLAAERSPHASPPRRIHQSGVRIVAVAALLLALAAGSVAILREGSQEAPVASDGGTTTTTTTGPPVPVLGNQVQVPVADLPDGWVQLDERSETVVDGDDVVDGNLIALYGAEGAAVDDAADDLVRVAWLPSRSFGSHFRAILEALRVPRPDYGEIAEVPNQSWQPPQGTEAILPQLPGEWFTVGVLRAPDELLIVQGRGIDLERLRIIAAEAVIRT